MLDFLGLVSRPIPPLPEAPCPHLLNSNDVPEPKEVTLIQEAIDEAKRAREQSASTSRCRQLLSGNLDRRRQELKNFIAQHTFILSPVRSIPDELLALIFEFYCDLQWDRQQQRQQRRQYEAAHPTHDAILIPALILQRVCVRWWRVVKSTPRLWSRLPGLLKVEKGGQIPSGFCAFKAQIDRAKLAPLSLRLEWHTPIKALESQHVSVDQANWVLATAEQWEELDFVAPNHHEFHEVYSLIRDKLTSLRRLKITFKVVCRNSPGRGSKTVEPLSLCPSIRSLQITYPVNSFADPQCLFPLPSQLRNLVLQNVSIPDGFYHSSGNFRHLHSLTIVSRFSVSLDQDMPPNAMAELMELRTLRLALRGILFWAGQIDLIWLFDHIICPSLENLELDALVDLNFMRELKLMMERSGYPRLRRLWLPVTYRREMSKMHKEALISLLGKTPSITDLMLGLYSGLVRDLALKPSLGSAAQGHEPVLLPNLKRVYTREEHAYAKELVTSRTTGLPGTTTTTTTTGDAPVQCAELEYLAIHFARIIPACNIIDSLYFPRTQGKESVQKWKSLIGIVASLSKTIESISAWKEIGQELKNFKSLYEANSLLDTIEIEAPKLDAIQLEYCGLPETMFEFLSNTNISEIRCRMLDILEKLEPIIAPDRLVYRWHIYGIHKDCRMLVYMKGGADGYYSFDLFWGLMSPDPLR